MAQIIFFHNPRCSKSREALALLHERGMSPEVRKYLEDPLSTTELKQVLELLGFADPRAMMRKGETEYASLGLDDPARSADELVAAMAAHPKLIERPVAIHGKRAVIGRPPIRVLEIL